MRRYTIGRGLAVVAVCALLAAGGWAGAAETWSPSGGPQGGAAFTLAVQSTPVEGVSITGGAAGTTNYTAALAEAVTLSAPLTATISGTDYAFVRWTLDGVDKQAGLASVRVTAGANHTAVAVYGLATPVSYLLVSSHYLDVGNQWTYEAHYTELYFNTVDLWQTRVVEVTKTQTIAGQTVSVMRSSDSDSSWEEECLQASAGSIVRYKLNDPDYIHQFDSAEAMFPVSITPDCNNTNVGHATYQASMVGLPDTWAGTGDVWVTLLRTETIGVTAGTFVCVVVRILDKMVDSDGVTLTCDRTIWFNPYVGVIKMDVVRDGEAGSFWLKSTTLKTRQINVQSGPLKAVDIAGDVPGATDYSALCGLGRPVHLDAPRQIMASSQPFAFAHWTLDGADRPRGDTGLDITMDAAHTMQAVYESSPTGAVPDLSAQLDYAKLTPAAAASSGDYNATFAAAKAIDGSSATWWESLHRATPQAEQLTLDLGAVKTLDRVRLLPSSSPRMFPADFTIEVSADGLQWTQVASAGGYAAQNGVWYEATFAHRSARYARLSVAAGRQWQQGVFFVQVAEFEAYRQTLTFSLTSRGGVEYDLRYLAGQPIAGAAQWSQAIALSIGITPANPFVKQSAVLGADVLPGESRVYFAVKVIDLIGGESPLSGSPYVDTPGSVPPSAVNDLAVTGQDGTSLTIRFTAVGDDGLVGTAAAYDVRYSTEPITDATWAAAAKLAVVPSPQPAGSSETIVVTGLNDETAYYVALKVKDDVGNESPLSNVASGRTADATPPAAVQDLQAAVAGQVQLSWTAPGDSGSVGTATSYSVRWSVGPITDANWAAARALAGAPAPLAAGTPQTMTVSLDLLPTSKPVYFALKATDEAANTSAISNVPSVNTGGVPYGDANGDCSVNVLDLIFIRDRLNRDVNIGDNRKADVNKDGSINILDLFAVRGNLNARCN